MFRSLMLQGELNRVGFVTLLRVTFSLVTSYNFMLYFYLHYFFKLLFYFVTSYFYQKEQKYFCVINNVFLCQTALEWWMITSSTSGSGSRNSWRMLQHCEMWHVCTVWLMFLEKLIGSWWKFYQRVSLNEEVPLNFGSHMDRESGSGLDSAWWTFVTLACC